MSSVIGLGGTIFIQYIKYGDEVFDENNCWLFMRIFVFWERGHDL